MFNSGYYTFEYAKEISDTLVEKRNTAFRDAVKIDTDEYGLLSDFLFEMAMKIKRQSVTAAMALHEYSSFADDNDEKKDAVQELLRGINGNLDV